MVCESYCSHGGICELEAGHEDLHDSGYCTWSDAEALTKAAADAVLAGKPGGSGFLLYEAMQGYSEGYGDDDELGYYYDLGYEEDYDE